VRIPPFARPSIFTAQAFTSSRSTRRSSAPARRQTTRSRVPTPWLWWAGRLWTSSSRASRAQPVTA